jgi:AraC family transcriptional regulator
VEGYHDEPPPTNPPVANENAPFAPITFGVVPRRAEGTGCQLLETVHDPHVRLALHSHQDVSIDVVLAGGFEERVGRRTFQRSRGSLLIKPAGIAHANSYGGSATRSVLLQLSVTSSLLADCSDWLSGDAIHIVDAAASRFGRSLVAILRRGESSMTGLDDTIAAILAGLASRRRRRPREPNSAAVVRLVREMIIDGGQPFHLATLARTYGLSPSELTHAFRRRYACTPGAVIRRQRLDRASRMLREPSLTLSQIAARSGFSDQAHFTREFRRLSGTTPGEYRRAGC